MNNEERRKRIEKIVKVIGVGVVGLFVAPYVLISIKGLIGLAIAGFLSFIIINFIPVVASMVANWRLKALKAEANRNPVETLQNDWNRKNSKIQEFRQSVVTFRGKIETFGSKLEKFDDKHPEEAERFRLILNKMKELLGFRERKLSGAQRDLELYKSDIEKAGDIWEMGQVANEMAEAAGMTEDEFFAEIQKKTAIDSIQNNINTAIAELDQNLLDEQNLHLSEGSRPQLEAAKTGRMNHLETNDVVSVSR
jgi:hypothetical protein